MEDEILRLAGKPSKKDPFGFQRALAETALSPKEAEFVDTFNNFLSLSDADGRGPLNTFVIIRQGVAKSLCSLARFSEEQQEAIKMRIAAMVEEPETLAGVARLVANLKLPAGHPHSRFAELTPGSQYRRACVLLGYGAIWEMVRAMTPSRGSH